MEVKIVKKIFYSFIFLWISIFSFAQESKVKYLLFDSSKDSIVEDYRYYKIDDNLFDISRYNQVDTITKKQMKYIKLTLVEELWKEGRAKTDSIIKREKRLNTGTIYISDTHNDFFTIYILEKINSCKYKRTRVWWLDYKGGCF